MAKVRFFETLKIFFKSPADFLKTNVKENIGHRIKWIIIFFLLYLIGMFIRYKGFTHAMGSTGQYYVIFVPLSIAIISLFMLFFCLKLFGLKSKLKDLAIFMLLLSSMGLFVGMDISENVIVRELQQTLGVILAAYFFIYTFSYIRIHNERHILITLGAILLYVIMVGVILFTVYSRILGNMSYELEREEKNIEYDKGLDFVYAINENSSREDMEKAIDFCKNEYNRWLYYDTLECYADIYPFYFKYNPKKVIELCLDEDAILSLIKKRYNRNRAKCLIFAALKIELFEESISICEMSPGDKEECECKSKVYLKFYNESKISEEHFIDFADSLSTFDCNDVSTIKKKEIDIKKSEQTFKSQIIEECLLNGKPKSLFCLKQLTDMGVVSLEEIKSFCSSYEDEEAQSRCDESFTEYFDSRNPKEVNRWIGYYEGMFD